MTAFQKFQKRTFDLLVAFIGLLFVWWLIFLAALIAWMDTGLNGFFVQTRVGKEGKLFKAVKIRSMRPVEGVITSVTTDNDPRISKIGRFLRKTKLDELPQLYNVLIGNMSFVGPRPDIPGFADKLRGKDRELLQLRPGITGPATIRFKNEEQLLATQKDPEHYNQEVIWPEKVRLNLEYLHNWSLKKDAQIIFQTVFS